MTPERGIVLITGSNGRIGSAVMRRLTGRFSDVVGFDLKAPTPPPPGCVRIPVDITSDASLEAGLSALGEHHGTHLVAVIHLAAYYDFLGKPSPKYDEITVNGTQRLLRELRENFEVEQFIFSSTMLVHRPGEPGQFITEDWPLGPTWAYPESKVRTEALIRTQRGNIPTVVLRLAGVYDDVCHSPPLAHQIQRIYERQLAGHLYSGETAHGQAFVHLEDVVDAIERTIERRAKLPVEVAVLIGEPETLSYDELQHTFMRLIHGKSGETYSVPGMIAKIGAWAQDHMPGEDQFIKPWMIDRANDHYALDITRARTLLDWQPKRSLRQTMPKMVAALKADPLGWYREHGLVPPASLMKQLRRAAVQALKQPAARGAEATSAPLCLMHACPMHPEVCQSSPGNCPRCSTPLEAVTLPQVAEYTCPMHPEVVAHEPGRCPKCGMPLELRTVPPPAHATHEDRNNGGMMLLFRAEILLPLLAWLGILAVLGALTTLAVIYSGIFNVAATVEDAPPLRWLLITTREASVRRHARAVQTPPLGAPEQLQNGFRIFRKACAMCHTPPGRRATMMSKGLNPQAPPLAELVEDMTANELFWVTKNGIRFTGMPAWEASLDDQEIWDLVAFMRTSPKMQAADYDVLDRRVPRDEETRE
jgi:nucleoside-diphosphate-sugar epimerase/mono/diheme cytochrome c family protein